AAVRSTVDQEGHRIFAPFDETRGLHHVTVHGLAVPAREVELLEGTHRRLSESCGTGASELTPRACALLNEQLLRGPEIIADVDGSSPRTGEVTDGTVGGEVIDLARRRLDPEQRLLPALTAGREERPSVSRPVEADERGVEAPGNLARATALEVHQHERRPA